MQASKVMRKLARSIERAQSLIERNIGKVAAVVGALAATSQAEAQSDLTGVLSSVSGYQTAAVLIGASIIAWVIGKRIVKTFAKG